MGITAVLETEKGEAITTVDDPANLLHKILPAPNDAGFQWANTIDWYADTTFNRIQARLLRTEWARLVERTPDESARKLLMSIDDLLERCDAEQHLYVKFYGD